MKALKEFVQPRLEAKGVVFSRLMRLPLQRLL